MQLEVNNTSSPNAVLATVQNRIDIRLTYKEPNQIATKPKFKKSLKTFRRWLTNALTTSFMPLELNSLKLGQL
jgi:hypothetical protein